MNCKDFQDIVDSYLSDELLTETNHEMMRHLDACSDCQNVIHARREIRNRLKTSVLAAPEFRLDENFDHKLMTRLRHEAGQMDKTPLFSLFGAKSFAAAAAVALVVLFGYGGFSTLGPKDSSTYLVSGFAEDSLVNIASGDHQHCAIDYDLEQAPIPLSKAGRQYQGLDSVIESEIGKGLEGHRLVEAHACEFKNVRFAHFVVTAPDNTISILVAPTGRHVTGVNNKISDFSSDSYQISTFDVEQNTVFVISAQGKERNRKAAETLEQPLEKHFINRHAVQATMLTAFAPAPLIF